MPPFVSSSELEAFHRGVEVVTGLLPEGEPEQIAVGIGRMTAAVSVVDGPEAAYAMAERLTFEHELRPEDSFDTWQPLAYLGVSGAIEQARVRAGVVVHDGKVRLREDIDLGGAHTGNQIIDLVTAGDYDVLPIARQFIRDTRDDPHHMRLRPRYAYNLYKAGDDQAIAMAIRTTQQAQQFAREWRLPYRAQSIDMALSGLGERMAWQGHTERLDEVIDHIRDPISKGLVLAADYAATGGLKEQRAIAAHKICLNGSLASGTRSIITTLIGSGYRPMVDGYREALLDNDVSVADEMVNPDVLEALCAAGETRAADRLSRMAEQADGWEGTMVFSALANVGRPEQAYHYAEKLYVQRPTRLLLQTMLEINFTTERWQELWDLPMSLRTIDEGMSIGYRANDLCELAAHLSGSELRLEP